jgi:serine/threonine-protein kinase RsbW
MPRRPRAHSQSTVLYNDRGQIEAVREQIVDALRDLNYPHASCFAVRLAFEEAVSNAFTHGHKGLPEDTPVRVSYSVGPDEVQIAVEDAGPGFDPGSIPDPTLDENLESLSGRGLLLIRSYMSSVEYNETGNRVVMTYRHPADA